MTPQFQPMPLQSRPLPFDDPSWVFELKYDGFRALAVIEHGRTELISCNGNPFGSFADLVKNMAAGIPRTTLTVLDGEIVCLDTKGRPQLWDLLFHRGDPCFFAFDLLFCDRKDWRRKNSRIASRSFAGCWGGCLSIPGCDTSSTLTESALYYFSEYASWTWRASWRNRSPARTSASERAAHGSRFATGNIRRWRAVRSCSSVNATRNQ